MDLAETQSLRQEIERALRGAFDPADVLPRLARLARLAAPSSDDAIFANQKLAELLVERDPWRAALYVRRALARRDSDDRSWAVLAFCQTLLGNFRCAASAYAKAIACAPANPWYAHNLGHLLDVALGEPARALAWLDRAYRAKSDNSEIVASYAHALARAGRIDDARGVLERARGRVDSRELDALLRWLDQGAPARARRDDGPPSPAKRRPPSATPVRLARVLARGLSHLPLDPRQRERALALARDALPPPRRKRSANDAEPEATRAAGTPREADRGSSGARPSERDVAGLAAAVAYAIVYIDHVPLSQAEVAAPFRVGVAHLRGRFAELRAKLDIIRGDARYATTRR
ncbi:MAG: tetratricopeptide repeat protein [Labilithrix sp.]|nr:tetratricopeptide repeat protein [Labilithrix sp.]